MSKVAEVLEQQAYNAINNIAFFALPNQTNQPQITDRIEIDPA